MAAAQSKDPPAFLPAGLCYHAFNQRSLCYDALALAVAATAFLVEPLDHAAGVSSSRSNGASQEGQGNED